MKPKVLFALIKNKQLLQHNKNAQLAYMVLSHDLDYHDPQKENEMPEPTEYDPFEGII